jgi:hypothetical protein
MNEFINYIKFYSPYFLLLPLLYAETHYRFKYFYSYLKKREPEILADIPSRILKDKPLPVLVIIKDADKYPVMIKEIEIKENNQTLFRKEVNQWISEPYRDFIYSFNSNQLKSGHHLLDVKIIYKIGEKELSCLSDNHRGTSHKPLNIYVASDPLPRFENCILGETHCHTNFTSDQVEFGASLMATASLANAMGLNFFCATDHSYDLDDYEDNYLLNDPDLAKWEKFKKDVNTFNCSENEFFIIPGEEVTVRNGKEKNVHILVYGSDRFFPGSGDSGEKWLQTRSELSISDVVDKVLDSDLVFAAHPVETPPFLQKLFIRRDVWHKSDCRKPGIHGIQFINGGVSKFNALGKEFWINLLLEGDRLIGLAGNDAHGNFSRFRQVGFPFFTMRENYHHLFGKWRTGVYTQEINKNIGNTIKNIKAGNCYMTNGPALQFQCYGNNQWYPMGASCQFPLAVKLMSKSTEEFSELTNIKLILGDINNNSESILIEDVLSNTAMSYKKDYPLKDLPGRGYLRMEVLTKNDFQAFSNPIWF